MRMSPSRCIKKNGKEKGKVSDSMKFRILSKRSKLSIFYNNLFILKFLF